MSIPSIQSIPADIGIDHSDNQPWMDQTNFPAVPMPLTYGYRLGKTDHQCSQEKLIEQVQEDKSKKISMVWTPDHTHLLPPEEVPWLFDAVRAREHAYLKQARSSSIINIFLWGFPVVIWVLGGRKTGSFALFNLVVLGIIPLLEHTWNLYRLRSYAPETMARGIPEARYGFWIRSLKAPWTWALVICISSVAVIQLVMSLRFFLDSNHSSILAAGIVKPAIRAGEWWRLLTGTFLHGNPLHFLFNIVALFVLGKILEVSFHRVYLPIVFVLSALAGSILSLLLLPDVTSVGASGGILGLLGFLLVFAWKQQNRLPRTLRRNLLVSVVYTAVAGLFAYQIIDNPAHFGGFTAGALLGIALVRRQVHIPERLSPLLSSASILASGVILATTVLSLYMIVSG